MLKPKNEELRKCDIWRRLTRQSHGGV